MKPTIGRMGVGHWPRRVRLGMWLVTSGLATLMGGLTHQMALATCIAGCPNINYPLHCPFTTGPSSPQCCGYGRSPDTCCNYLAYNYTCTDGSGSGTYKLYQGQSSPSTCGGTVCH